MADSDLGRVMAETLDSDALMKLNDELMAKLRTGTATRTDKTKLKATMHAIQSHKADADAISKSLTQAELLKRNEALMAKVKCGTATRSDVEKFHLVTSALKTDVEERAAAKAEAATLDTDALIALNAELMAKLRTGTATRTDTTKAKVMTSALRTRKATLDGVAKETDVDALLKRNAELMKSFKVGTATRADVEAIKAVMKRKEELDAMLVEDKARETASKLETVRFLPHHRSLGCSYLVLSCRRARSCELRSARQRSRTRST